MDCITETNRSQLCFPDWDSATVKCTVAWHKYLHFLSFLAGNEITFIGHSPSLPPPSYCQLVSCSNMDSGEVLSCDCVFSSHQSALLRTSLGCAIGKLLRELFTGASSLWCSELGRRGIWVLHWQRKVVCCHCTALACLRILEPLEAPRWCLPCARAIFTQTFLPACSGLFFQPLCPAAGQPWVTSLRMYTGWLLVRRKSAGSLPSCKIMSPGASSFPKSICLTCFTFIDTEKGISVQSSYA